MSRRERRSCVVSNDGCLAPAGVGIPGHGYADGEGSTRATCHSCGEPVCTNRSELRVRRRGTYRRRRICDNCFGNW